MDDIVNERIGEGLASFLPTRNARRRRPGAFFEGQADSWLSSRVGRDLRWPSQLQPGINESDCGEEQKIEYSKNEILPIASLVSMYKSWQYLTLEWHRFIENIIIMDEYS